MTVDMQTNQGAVSVVTSDGVRLTSRVTGSGTPMIFLHEFSGDSRSWEPQVRFLGRRYQCITYDARGFPPSDIPEDPDSYSPSRAVEDALDVLDAVAPGSRAHVVGASMGGFVALELGIRHPERVLSITVAACGSGSGDPAAFRSEAEAAARLWAESGAEEAARRFSHGAFRIPFLRKDPRGWEEWAGQLAEHDARGAALTLLGVHRRRRGLDELADDLAAVAIPVLMIAGDEDEATLAANVRLKGICPTASLAVFPRTGHTVNLEEPGAFNQSVLDFATLIDTGGWRPHDRHSDGGRRAWGRAEEKPHEAREDG